MQKYRNAGYKLKFIFNKKFKHDKTRYFDHAVRFFGQALMSSLPKRLNKIVGKILAHLLLTLEMKYLSQERRCNTLT